MKVPLVCARKDICDLRAHVCCAGPAPNPGRNWGIVCQSLPFFLRLIAASGQSPSLVNVGTKKREHQQPGQSALHLLSASFCFGHK
mmetsp:Transcript_55805/g.118876  ORF Transcript_55805/g.118876 Transcript_55805/m.118876 type:complete len:86 (+) Transcript_55805:134-391(+)